MRASDYVARPMLEYNHETFQTETLGWWVEGLGQFATEDDALAAIRHAAGADA